MIVGIDLGTTNSAVAIWRDGKAELIPNAIGDLLTPSAVSLSDDGAILVGMAARERQATHPDRTATVFKRLMGTQQKTRLGRKSYSPEELSALVLRALKADAEAWLGEEVVSAVITVPAYFNDRQRKATRRAGEMAGSRSSGCSTSRPRPRSLTASTSEEEGSLSWSSISAAAPSTSRSSRFSKGSSRSAPRPATTGWAARISTTC
jgi:hypothetical protein